jgi:hypothetical protein
MVYDCMLEESVETITVAIGDRLARSLQMKGYGYGH